MYGNYGRRSPSPLRNQQVGVLRRGGGRLGIIPPPPPPPPQSEPDRDDAFIQETGIKVYQSTPAPRGSKREDSEDGGMDSDDEEGEEEDCDVSEDDDCYEIMDDAIIEEDNEDDDDDDDEDEDDEEDEDEDNDQNTEKKKESGSRPSSATASKPRVEVPVPRKASAEEVGEVQAANKRDSSGAHSDTQEASSCTPSSLCTNRSSSGVSSSGSSGILQQGSELPQNHELPPVKINEPVQLPSEFLQQQDLWKGPNPSSASSGPDAAAAAVRVGSDVDSCNEGDISRSSSEGNSCSSSSTATASSNTSVVRLNKKLSSSLKGLNKLPSPTTAPASHFGTLSAHTTPTKDPPVEYLVRGKQGRMSLPIRDRFSVRPTSLQDGGGGPAGDQRSKELKPTRIIWFRRSFKASTVSFS